ncbi:hypothetical protein PSACC_01221 [Paramicrosporidium saccamoebae]|uniref:Thiolase N-terminal domain-containing protein n=1 Tax=Paramicrosporidium saccamoebae TaxID=1246581 RepID=A0A2H9TMK5_9FUNG|nr:hypothetical protein PSACC_01221 [Paramicrosporidium saccamoebae]
MGSFQGALASIGACELGAEAIKSAVSRAGLGDKLDLVDEVLMGNVLSAGLGQSPASTAARLAGLPPNIPTTIVNKVCASGMKAVTLAAASIRAGQSNVVIAGGMESMSRAPHLLLTSRTGTKFGDQTLVDSLRLDGLTDTATGWGMGLCGEKCASDYEISRELSDEYAQRSYERAIAAKAHLVEEIAPVYVPAGKGQTIAVAMDEGPNNVCLGKP